MYNLTKYNSSYVFDSYISIFTYCIPLKYHNIKNTLTRIFKMSGTKSATKIFKMSGTGNAVKWCRRSLATMVVGATKKAYPAASS